MSADQIRALRHERERHELAGRAERVAAIDREIAALNRELVAPFAGALQTAQDNTPVEKAVKPRARRK